ncbi:PKD domain-containing protein [Xylanibacillus composti]|uniref:PKD domain-containing protein n=1 Tax=Xylanibacillus composti TaxID=1572762 RepID=UPI001BCD27CF|nr:PKD domain-containing protein [Xylanibacillus composti]
MKFRNLKTNTTRDVGVIRTYTGSVVDSCCEHIYSMVTPVPHAVISGDGKLILANYYSNVLIYDMQTYALEGDIPTGMEDPLSYREYRRGGEDRDRHYFIKQMHLTEDGRLKIVYRTQYDNDGGSSDSEEVTETLYTIQTTPGAGPTYSYGYLPVNNQEFQNGDVSLKVTFNRDTFSDSASAGIGFRSQNHRNMYRAELSTDRVSLVKYVNGVPTVLGSYDYPIREGQTYTLRVRARGAHMTVYVNGVPVIEKSDSTYAAGRFGLYAEVPHVVLKDLQAELFEGSGSNVENQAIVNMPITYTKSYNDLENDPLISDMTTWTFTNTQPYKFLNAGDGHSDRPGTNTYNGVTVREPSPTLTKVGVFKVDLKETDDPAPSGFKYPNNRYAEYRKESYPATRYIVVHRQPIARFTVSVSSTDHTVIWNDTSYDPDRWLSATNYSTEATGINYRTTRGILERKYYYKTPSGQIVNSKLVTPREIGVYTVGLAVKDEYGAWSDWTTQDLEITTLPEPDEPPKAGFTVSTTSTYRGVNVTIISTASDKEDGPAANLPHEYYIRNLDSGEAETLQSTSRGTWTKSFSSIGRMQIRQVVTDSKGQSDQAIRIVTVNNRPPTANVTTPASSNTAAPTELDELRPTLRFTYSDADGDTQERFQLRISRYDGTLVMDSGEIRSGSRQWVPTADLPEDVNLQVRVRVHDGIEWGNYSSPKYMVIHTNKPPTAQFDWVPKPVWEGDTVTLLDQSTDPDSDILIRQWQITTPDGSILNFGDVGIVVQRFAEPGRYRVALTVSDGRESDRVEHLIEAQPLTLEAQVNHTPNWLEAHERLGHETETPPKDFYSGEKWLLAAASSPYPVEEVWASFSAKGRDGRMISLEVRLQEDGAPDRFAGEMYDERMTSVTEGLAPDLYEVNFRIRYGNGVEKEATVPLRIIGSVYEPGGVFRRR